MVDIADIDEGRFKVITAADIANYERPVLVKIDDFGQVGFIARDYWIDLDRIKDRAALIGWIHHLLGKRWVTSEMLIQFIETVCNYRKWPIYKGFL